MSMSADEAELLDLIRRGHKIEAIKRLREARGLGLREATAEIERLDSKQAAAATTRPPRSVDFDVRQLAQSGQRIAAIKLLRERNRLGLKEAKDLLDATVPPPPGKPVLPRVAAVLVAAATAAYLLLR
jgi:ribosomal protein L7/L12